MFMHASADPEIVPGIQQVLNLETVNELSVAENCIALATKLERSENMQAKPTTEQS